MQPVMHEIYDDDRGAMVRYQLRARGIRDARVLHAMKTVPRHLFLPESAREMAYVDAPVPIGYGQTISQPLMVALMLVALELTENDRVLEVGTGSGYQAALLAMLARHVTSVEIVPQLADRAARTLAELGYDNVDVVRANGSLGWPRGAPYDAIVVAAAAPDVPPALVAQLADGGRLVLPVGRGLDELVRVRRRGDRVTQEELGGCAFVPLVGANGWH